MVIIFSGGEIGQPGDYDASIPVGNRTAVLSSSKSAINVRLADLNGNPLPADAALSTSIIPSTSTCKAEGFSGVIGNSTEPTSHGVVLDSCAGGEIVLFKVGIKWRW
ncbi:MAG: hypothetical protein IPH37_00300 [Burkholderiales bacterium]|nr:hypothetical protein [Burkholderiales bacterium]